MQEIENQPNTTFEQRKKDLAAMDDTSLVAQDLVQQGAIHALSTLIQMGTNENNAIGMLCNLKAHASIIRDEFQRRNQQPVFNEDQTKFN